MDKKLSVTNAYIAGILRTIADRLNDQGANAFRIAAYRTAASTVEQLEQPIAAYFDAELDADTQQHPSALDSLEKLPGIGQRLARTIEEIVHTGHCATLQRLNGHMDPEALFCRVPGIGPVLAQQIHQHLNIDSLTELELCAHDGRLATVAGIGPRRLEMIQSGLSKLLSRTRNQQSPTAPHPSVGDLLHIDAQYRQRAQAGELPKIAPTRFNPEHLAWLPVWHTQYKGWDYTALYSNTALAHERHRTQDWVVLYFEDQSHHEGQATVVTEYHGPIEGKRVVRGQEQACIKLYEAEHEQPDNAA